jgi:transcriptional regulator with XRE-family HTH domain
MLVNDFPLLLKRARRNRGWTQEQLAKELGVTRITVSRWEQGETVPPSFYWSRLSAFLQVPIEGFLVELPESLLGRVVASQSLPNGRDDEQSSISQVPNHQELIVPILSQTYPFSLWEQEHFQLDLEQQRLEIQEKRLDLQQKWQHAVCERIAIVLDLLHVSQDQTIRKEVTGKVLSSLEALRMPYDEELPLPTFNMIKEAFDVLNKKEGAVPNERTFPSHQIRESASPVETLVEDKTLGGDRSSALDFERYRYPQTMRTSVSSLRGQLNPYLNKTMIRNLDMFFGRTDLLRRLYESVFSRQSVSIVGSRGIGKSSLLWYSGLPEVQAHFPFDLSHFIFVFLGRFCENGEDFFNYVSEALLQQGRKAHLSFRIESSVLGGEKFSHLLGQIADQGYFPVLLLDAFDKVTRNEHFEPEFFEFLRSHASLGLVSYITATLVPLSEVCHRGIASSPFFNIFHTHKLEALRPEEAWELINLPVKRAGLPLSEEESSMVLRLAGRHPFFIQRVCSLLYNHKRGHGNAQMDERSLKIQAWEELSPLFKDIWAELSEGQRTLLIDEARQKDRQQRALPELSESALFRHFVRETCRVKLFHLTIEDLEKALELFNNLTELGKTDLGVMEVVTHRLQQTLTPSPRDKGKIIREVFYEAFESLRGPEPRSDEAPEWIPYNILYYRYFQGRNRLKNEQISARLCLSVRAYYRERDKAIELLREALLNIEEKVSDREP